MQSETIDNSFRLDGKNHTGESRQENNVDRTGRAHDWLEYEAATRFAKIINSKDNCVNCSSELCHMRTPSSFDNNTISRYRRHQSKLLTFQSTEPMYR